MSNPKKEKSNPKNLQEVVDEWRKVEHAQGVQAMLWTVFYSAMASPEANEWGPITRGNVLFLYQRLHNLVHDLDPDHSMERMEMIDDWMS